MKHPVNLKKQGFTLLELIVVIIIIGVLATLGFTQYTQAIEKGRTSEAKTVLSTMRSADAAYYMEYGTYASSMTNLYVNAPTSCTSTHFFSFNLCPSQPSGCICNPEAQVYAYRCTSGGKTPNVSATYGIRVCLPSGRYANDAPY